MFTSLTNHCTHSTLVSIMMANNEINCQPIKNYAKSHILKAIFHTDAVQAIGHIPVNVHDLVLICYHQPINLMALKG